MNPNISNKIISLLLLTLICPIAPHHPNNPKVVPVSIVDFGRVKGSLQEIIILITLTTSISPITIINLAALITSIYHRNNPKNPK